MSLMFTPREAQQSSGDSGELAADEGVLFTRDSLLSFLQSHGVAADESHLQSDKLRSFATVGRMTIPSSGQAQGQASGSSTASRPASSSAAVIAPSIKPTPTTSAPPPAPAQGMAAIAAPKKRGTFIVVEGLDRAGKSSQVELLSQYLSERRQDGKVKIMKFPDRTTPIGRILNSYLTDPSISLHPKAVHLLFSANRWELHDQILRDLRDGWDIIADRYAGSGVAYSRAKGLDLPWLMSPDTSLPSPDLTLFLSLSAAAAAKRGGYGEERYEKEEMQRKVREAFAEIEAVTLNQRSSQSQVGEQREGAGAVARAGTKWRTLNAEKSLEEVFEEVKREVESVREEVGRSGRAIGGLWDGQGEVDLQAQGATR